MYVCMFVCLFVLYCIVLYCIALHCIVCNVCLYVCMHACMYVCKYEFYESLNSSPFACLHSIPRLCPWTEVPLRGPLREWQPCDGRTCMGAVVMIAKVWVSGLGRAGHLNRTVTRRRSKPKTKRPLGNEERQREEEGELRSAAFSQELPLKIEPGSSEQQLAGRLCQAVCESSDLELWVD